ncbi:MAG: hypothetical protein Q9212_006995 [Teloschistes hypoglaucus]
MSSPSSSKFEDAGVATTAAPSLASEDDAADLAKLGYKQELRRNFTMLEVFGIAFSIMGLLPSIASVLAYSIPAGPVGMADLASAMPTSDAFSLMFLSVIVIARDGKWAPTDGHVYGVFLAAILCHAVLSSVMSRIMGKLQTVFVFMNFVLIAATIIALPIGARNRRHSAKYIFTQTENLTSWPTGWTFMLSWLSPIWTIGAFDSCVHMSEEARNASKAVPVGIVASSASCWLFGFILMIVIAATINPDLESVTRSQFGQPMAQIYYDALGKHATMGLMSLLFIVQFLMGISILVAASRQAWAFSRDGALPFSSFFRHISKRFGVIPLRAVWGCAFLAAILGLLTLIAPAAAQAVFSLVVAANNLAWGIPILWGRQKFKPGPFYTGDRFSVPIAWTALLFLAFGILLSMFPVGGPNPTRKSFPSSHK